MNRALETPALDGKTVTEFHALVCRERGHMTHERDGVRTGWCPRCGEVTDPACDICAEPKSTHTWFGRMVDSTETWHRTMGYDVHPSDG